MYFMLYFVRDILYTYSAAIIIYYFEHGRKTKNIFSYKE